MSRPLSDRRLRIAIAALSALGCAIAAYLTVVKLSHVGLVCANTGCETVQQSRYAELAGVPISAFGLAVYVLLFASAFSAAETVRLAAAALALAAAAFAAYLVYLQLAVIDAVCPWCMTSDGLVAVLAALTLVRAFSPAVRAAPPV